MNQIQKWNIVVAFECYHGVNMEELKQELFPLLSPEKILFTDDFALSVEEVQAKISDTITDDRVFGVMSHYTMKCFFKEKNILKAKEEIEASDGLVIVYGMGTNIL